MGLNGPVVFSLNSGTDLNVTNNSALIAFGATAGSVDVSIVLSDAQENILLGGEFYLNIHSAGTPSGELRANLVRSVPEPSILGLLGAGLLGLAFARRKKAV